MCLLDGEERYASALFTRLQMPFSSPFMDPSHPPNARGCAVQAGGGYGLIQKGTCQSPHCLTRASVTFPSRGPCGLEGDSAGCKEQTSRHHLLSRRKETASAVTGSLMGGFELTGDETNGKSEQQLSPGGSLPGPLGRQAPSKIKELPETVRTELTRQCPNRSLLDYSLCPG